MKNLFFAAVFFLSAPSVSIAAPKPVYNSLNPESRIDRLVNLMSASQIYSYKELGSAALCAEAPANPSVIYCVTEDTPGWYPSNALLSINLSQNLMFFINRNESCGMEETLRISALYGDSKVATDDLIPIDSFASSFDTYSQIYNTVMGCQNQSNSKWKFINQPFGFNMVFKMPWQGHLRLQD